MLLVVAAAAFGGYKAFGMWESAQAEIAELKTNLAGAQEENEMLAVALQSEKDRMQEFAEQIEEITGTVGILDKLRKTDKELLQKYSRTYFLNEHYIPARVVEIPEEYRSPPQDDEYFHASAWKFLDAMLEDAKDDGITIAVTSGYRSFDEQKDVKARHMVAYGTAANRFSADQGYSEHQLGTTADFTTPSLNGGLEGFDKTPAYTWLTENAYRYGFVLSYPPGNAFYQFEPWHWRFVGKDLARRLHQNDEYFYDLEQREIDEYLVELFD